MNHLLSALTKVAPTPSPYPTMSPDFNADSVTPTVVGFAATLLVAVVVILLLIDMNRRIRRVRYRAEVNEKLDAERAASEASDGSSVDGTESDVGGRG